ncbi:MAG: tryptophan synthase subunit alpha [Acidobacteria bacterium]|nr:tryptophan synthase subunit alpha [Acidobacteriota bacterium]
MSRIKQAYADAVYEGRRPVIPCFPFPVNRRQKAFRFILELAERVAPTGIGLVYPGRQVFVQHPAVAPAPEEFSEWDLFQFVYALKAQTGQPVVLAIHYRDIVGFGVIPYGQEGHKVGLDALLVRQPIVAELDYFAAEMLQHGVGLSFIIDAGVDHSELTRLRRYATAFVYVADDMALSAVLASHETESAPVFHSCRRREPAPGAQPGEPVRTGILLDHVLPGSPVNPTWEMTQLDQACRTVAESQNQLVMAADDERVDPFNLPEDGP